MQGIFTEIPTELIDPSPYQKRRRFDPESLQRLADDIGLNGLLNPVLCRVMNGRYELVHGERRWRAVSLIPWQNIPSQVREMTDLEARRICAAENVHREDLTPIELIDATADWVDSCLMSIEGYQDFGETYLERVGNLLNIFWNQNRISKQNNCTYKFISTVKEAFKATNRNITWQTFYNNDLRPYLKLDEDVKEVSIKHSLAKSKAPELQKLKEAAPKVFEEVKETGQINLGVFVEDKYSIEEVSAREIKQRAEAKGRGVGVHFSSNTSEWYTPQQIIERVLRVMNEIDLDPCSNSHDYPNVPAGRYYTKEDDGLSQKWRGRVYMNPPYGLEIADWVSHLCGQFEIGNVTEAIALLPSRTDTEWFRRLRQYPRCFIWGRLRFSGNEVGAPFPSMVVYLGANTDKFTEAFRDIGDIYVWLPTESD